MSAEPTATENRSRRGVRPLLLLLAVALGVGAALLVGHWVRGPRPAPPLMRATVSLPAGLHLDTDNASLAFSPDGQQLAFVAIDGSGKQQLWLRSMNGSAVRPLARTDGATYPFWSPDSRSIAFFADHMLKRINLAAGTVLTVCAAEDGRGGSWNRQGTIVFAPLPVGGLYRVPAAGGNPIQVSIPDRAAMTQRLPQFLPDGRHLLFFSGTEAPGEQNGIYVLEMATGRFRLLARENSVGRYVAPGFLAFVRGEDLMVQHFDARDLRLSGQAIEVAKNVAFNPRQWTGTFSFSSGGLLVFQIGTPAPKARLTWLSLDGKQTQPVGAPQEFGAVAVSPDARRAVAQIADGPGRFLLWLYELRQGASLRFTSAAQPSTRALWSPDGKQVVYGDGAGNLFVQTAKGVKPARQVLSAPEPVVPTGWSPDGHLLAYQEHSKNGWDLWIVPITGDRKPYSFLSTAFNETAGTFSADGHWFSYLSDESGRKELYVAPFPAGGNEQKISTDGAQAGGWVPGQAELAYLTPKHRLVIVRADIHGAKLTLEKPEVVLAGRRLTGAAFPAGAPSFFSPDGKRILYPLPMEKSVPTTLTLVTNWTTGLHSK